MHISLLLVPMFLVSLWETSEMRALYVQSSTPVIQSARVSGRTLYPLVTMSFTTAVTNTQGNVTKLPGQATRGYIDQLPGGVKLEMVEIPGGRFIRGVGERGTSDNIRFSKTWPRHVVTIRDLYVGRFEITQAQWKAVMGSLPLSKEPELLREFKGDSLPVILVTWHEAKTFIEKLNRLTGGDYRLLSEAEWEYTARAGSQEEFCFGPTITPELANYNRPFSALPVKGEYVGHPVKVGNYPANKWGVFDMHGNVAEWCEDTEHHNYIDAPSDGRAWVDATNPNTSRVIRGGNFFLREANCKASYRAFSYATECDVLTGFRICRTAQSK